MAPMVPSFLHGRPDSTPFRRPVLFIFVVVVGCVVLQLSHTIKKVWRPLLHVEVHRPRRFRSHARYERDHAFIRSRIGTAAAAAIEQRWERTRSFGIMAAGICSRASAPLYR